GLLAQFAAFPLATPFVVSAVLSVGSVAAAASWSRTPAPTKAATFTQVPDRAERSGTGVKVALLWALPLAPWVFASATV
ncbi:MFS transporter, partial [Rhodococcus erythropolis]|nr:MFS transporter [Rhodococcus erythropolis]